MLKLGGKLILGVLLTLGSILSVGFYFALEKQTNGMLDEVRDNSTAISKIVSSGLGELFGEIQNQHDQLQELVVHLARLSGIKHLMVLNEQYQAIAHTNPEMIGSALDGPLHIAAGQAFDLSQSIDVSMVDDQTTLYRLLPITERVNGESQVIGVVMIALQQEGLVSSHAEAVSRVVRDSMARVLRQAKDKRRSLNHLVAQIRNILTVEELEVYNEQFMLLQPKNTTPLVDSVALSSLIKQSFKNAQPIETEDFERGYYQRLTPIFSLNDSSEVIGVVRLVMDLKPALAKIESLSHTMRLIALTVAVAIFFVLSWLMQRVLIRPVKVLSESANLLSQGHFHKVAVPSSNDEIAQLGRSFNSMVDYLSDYQEKLVSANEYSENILRTMGDALLVVGLDDRIEHVNDAALKLLHYRNRADLVGFPISLVCSNTPSCSMGNQLSFMLESVDFNDQEKYLITRRGDYVPVLLSFSHIYDAQGNVDGAVCVARDITERMRAQQSLREAHDELERRVKQRTDELFKEKERLQVTLRSIGEAVVTADFNGCVEYLNPAAERITGWVCKNVRGRPLEEVLPLFDESGGRLDAFPLYQCLNDGYCDLLSTNHSMNLLNKDGQMVAIESSMAPMLDNQGTVTGVVLVFRDVSEERKLRKQLLHQANHDALTGLSNRLVFEKRLGEALQLARSEHIEHAVLFLDLDQFKVVNDTCGHVAGDVLLQQLTSLLRDKMRVTDILARLGGDEFGVILNNCSLDHAKKIAVVLLDTVREFRFIWEDKTFEIGVSIGLVMLDETSESVASVMSAADVACYAAKDGGRNRYHIYETSDKELKQRHGEMQWVTLISKAINENRFALHLQEIASLNPERNKSKHYEVLLRMVRENGELVPPGAFLPAAERYGLITNVDRWVVEHGFAMLARYLAKNPGKGGVFAINLSGLSIGEDGFLEYIKERMALHEIPYESICFEITETAAVANLTKAIKFFKSLRALGCKFALDDFGCGVSSFSYLKNLPVDYLKIDGMFVRDMVDDSIDYAMVEAINNIGQVMGLKTIAEFVENQPILDCLVALDVDYAQGYFIAEPTPLDNID